MDITAIAQQFVLTNASHTKSVIHIFTFVCCLLKSLTVLQLCTLNCIWVIVLCRESTKRYIQLKTKKNYWTLQNWFDIMYFYTFYMNHNYECLSPVYNDDFISSLQFIWQKCVFLSLSALGISAYVQHHMMTWLYHTPEHQSMVHTVLWSPVRPFGTVYRRLFASRQYWENFKNNWRRSFSVRPMEHDCLHALVTD